MKHTPRHLILLGLLAFPAFAATSVFDFETAAEAEALPYRVKGKSALAVVPAFATSGTNSLRFSTAAWKPGLPEWPSFELKTSVRDWRGYDRLVVDLTNPSEARFHFALFASDSTVPIRKGLSHTFAVPSFGFSRWVVPLSEFPDGVKRSDITTLHFFTTRPPADIALHIDNIALLKKGESLPEPPAAFVGQLSALSLNALSAADRTFAALGESVKPYCDTPPVQANAQSQLARIGERLRRLRADFASSGLTLGALDALQAELAGMSNRTERLLSTLRFQQACDKAGLPTAPMLAGVASPMAQVLPRDAPFSLTPTRTIEINLARSEKESVQVVVLPAETALAGVAVRVTDLQGPKGARFSKDDIDCHVTGYVQTKNQPPYGSPHIGWWPDPLLNFLGPVDIATGDLQSFWIRVRAPQSQPPGTYRGTLTVTAENAPAFAFDLRVRVYDFTLPSASPLPLAITFSPHDSPIAETKDSQAVWRKSPDYPIAAWRKHVLQWADLLADYYISCDSLYHHAMPDFEILKHLQSQGRLGRFNLGYWYYYDDTDASRSRWQTNTLDRLRASYAQAQASGLLGHAYIYGCDEVPTNHFARVEEAAARIRAACPGVPIMTTTYDHSFGQTSGITSVDAFCPLTPKFDPEQVAKARAAGKQVWWYICCSPRHPHANLFIEYPAIEARLLMGAMTAKMRPDGFLYYQISIWNSEKPITSGPFTDWEPRSWTTYHGDGAWTCVGPDGTPLPTQRLENFRDGLEDFAYVKILEGLLKHRAAEPPTAWSAEAKAALAVPAALVRSMTDYSRDPQVLTAWREHLAALIERAPEPLEPLLK